MRRSIFVVFGIFCLGPCVLGQAYIFRSKIVGIDVQSFGGVNKHMVRFTGIDSSDGYTYLRAFSASGDSGDILRTKLVGTAVQGFNASPGCITGFTAVTSGEWQCLIAEGSLGTSDTVIKTKLSGTGVQTQSCDSGYDIINFSTYGPDAEGYVYLGITCELAGVEEERVETKHIFELGPIIPNPFLQQTQICYSIAEQGKVSLKVYDYTGRKVAKLTDTEQEPGTYSVKWDGKDENGKKVRAGIYFVRLEASEVKTRKIVVIN